MQKKNIRIRIPLREKIKAELQKEISSSCPFCMSSEVGHFEIHHIDEDRTNNKIENLILVCPTCHSKITKRDITQLTVLEAKNSFVNKSVVQHISTSVDQQMCGWKPISNVENAFEVKTLDSLFPVFNFSFISSSDQTLLLTHVTIRIKKLPIGMTGRYIPLPSILRPTITYKIKIPKNLDEQTMQLEDELEIPANRAFKFQIELYSDSMDEFNPPGGKYVVFLKFRFNNSFEISIPKILLNSSKDYDTLNHYGLS